MKGLPLAYSKDMQEDKEQVFDAAENLELAIAAMAGMVRDLTINVASMKRRPVQAIPLRPISPTGWCVNWGCPSVRHITSPVAQSLWLKAARSIWQSFHEELQSIHPGITDAIFGYLTVEKSVKSRQSFGGTAPQEVRRQIRYWKKRITKA